MNKSTHSSSAFLLSLTLLVGTFSNTAQALTLQRPENVTTPSFSEMVRNLFPDDESDDPSTTSRFRGLLRRIFPDDESEDPPTTSRGDLCLLAPTRLGPATAIWHQRPVFIWQGNIGRLEIQDTVTDEVLWRYQPTTEETYVRYGGEPLQSGRTYQWQIYITAESESAIVFPSFRLLSAANRTLLNNGLSIADQDAPAVNGGRELARAQYFVDRQLPLDALHEIFLVDEPEAEFIEARQELIDSMCQ